MIFENRQEAGELLLLKLKDVGKEAVVLAIPRGGVVVGQILAQNLKLPLDILVVKKIGAPDNPELAIGAVGPEKATYLDHDLISRLQIKGYQVESLMFQVEKEQKEREEKLRGEKPYELKEKTVILVDDGAATGATVLAAVRFLRKKKVKKVVLAVPVIAYDTLNTINKYFDEVIFLDNPSDFYAVGQFYRNFPQVSDEEVIDILNSR